MEKTFYSNGKLLLTGEYIVLDGGTGLAIPTQYGQSLKISEIETSKLLWKSITSNGSTWFEAEFQLKDGVISLLFSEDKKVANTLIKILNEAQLLNPDFLRTNKGYIVNMALDFPREWGLGSSSTLINNIAQWACVDAFVLLENSFGGSGYDIAAAQHNTPIFYERTTPPRVKEVYLPWEFTEQLFFVHLNKKQDSKKGIQRYRATSVSQKAITQISDISKKLLLCYTLEDFSALMNHHETLISEIIQLPTIKSQYFSDYPHTIKSLGAWGGDFVLCVGSNTDQEYFRKKGYNTIISYNEMLK